MQTKILFLILISVLSFNCNSQAIDTLNQKTFFVGSTFFLLGNLASTNNPEFFQLNFGYRLTKKDVVSLELKTWRYAWSLGIPYGPSFQAKEEKFPGYIREYGFAFAYQRFIWKGLFAGVHVMNSFQSFYNENNLKIDNGFQIFNTYRLGYYFSFFDNKFFIEPSLAITHRPYHTKMPASFKVMDDKWSRFFFAEPGFHFGFNF